MTIALICSVDLELQPVLRHLDGTVPHRLGSIPAHRGFIGGREVLAFAGGMGKTNAASALTWAISSAQPAGIVGFGVAGAYAAAGARVGQVMLAESEVYGDEGVATADGWISCQGIGIPLARIDGAELYNEFSCDPVRVGHALNALEAAGKPAGSGRFVTVSQCSGTRVRGDELAGRFDAVCETMEGAAYAHVAALHRIPFLELRGISNLVEDRDLSRWQLREAAENAAAAVAVAVAAWHPPEPTEVEL